MVVVNLYEFEKVAAKEDATVDELIENIDIGGPTMIRAAAKNWQDVAVVTSPDDYAGVLVELGASKGELSASTCWTLAKKAFALTAEYDAAITARLARIDLGDDGFSDLRDPAAAMLDIMVDRKLALRYGENPHQSAALYSLERGGIAGAKQLHGKELSYNNLVDLDAAWQLIQEFDEPAAAIIKHTNPCGCAEGETLCQAYRRAFEADPVSGLRRRAGLQPHPGRGNGGGDLRRRSSKRSLRRAIRPRRSPFSPPRRTCGCSKCRPAAEDLVVKSISGGYLAQTADLHRLNRDDAKVVTERAPTDEEWARSSSDGRCPSTSSRTPSSTRNAGQSVRVGAGQMSRVDSVKVGAMKAVLPLGGTVLASDAFFPVPGRRRGSGEAWHHGGDPARRVGEGFRRDRGREPARTRDGVHRRAPFPALARALTDPCMPFETAFDNSSNHMPPG